MIRGHEVPVKRRLNIFAHAHITHQAAKTKREYYCLAVPAALCRKIYHAFNLLVAMRYAPKFV